MKPVAYDLEQIGVNDSWEAVTVHWYCSEPCREVHATTIQLAGQSADWIEGTQCENCGKELQQ